MQGPAGVRRSAEIARAKAIRDGFSNVEAQGMTRQQVAAAFTDPKANGVYLDGTGASKVVVHCSDGRLRTSAAGPAGHAAARPCARRRRQERGRPAEGGCRDAAVSSALSRS